MSDTDIIANTLIADQYEPIQSQTTASGEASFNCDPALPALITKAASKQTYYTIRFLVDKNLTFDAYRAYAYFRWVDDMLDERLATRAERMAFLERQQSLINDCYQGEMPGARCAEESILTDLIRNHPERCSGLELYIRNMIAVMAFDADRRGYLVSQRELSDYSEHLATAVTEALHYFIGHDDPSPCVPARYLAVRAAHITHMLRDTIEDNAAGYYNVPYEFLDAHDLDPCDINEPIYRLWVKERVQLARSYFKAGKRYLTQVENTRCRLAGYAYTARFEVVLNAIEKDGYQLRPAYPERKGLRGGLSMARSLFLMMLDNLFRGQS